MIQDKERDMNARAEGQQSEGLLSPEQVANVCGLSRRAVYRAIARGELPAARLCHRLRVRPKDLELWVSGQMLSLPAVKTARARHVHASARGSLRAMFDQTHREESQR